VQLIAVRRRCGVSLLLLRFVGVKAVSVVLFVAIKTASRLRLVEVSARSLLLFVDVKAVSRLPSVAHVRAARSL